MGRRLARHVIVIALMVVACSDGRDAPATAPAVRLDMPTPTDGTPPENLALPLTSLLWLTETDMNLLAQATTRVTADCMAERGFDYPEQETLEFPSFLRPHPFGPWAEGDVADGYGPSVGPTQHSAMEEFEANLPPEIAQSWHAAHMGSNPFGGTRPTVTLPDGTEVESGFAEGHFDSCSFEGRVAVFGDYLTREELRQEIEALANIASSEAEEHEAVDRALDVWHDCMEAEGVDVGTDAEAPNDLAVRFISEPGISDEERQVATIDIRCKREANLHDAYFVARIEAEEEMIEENQLFVEAYREIVTESLARAREILGGG